MLFRWIIHGLCYSVSHVGRGTRKHQKLPSWFHLITKNHRRSSFTSRHARNWNILQPPLVLFVSIDWQYFIDCERTQKRALRHRCSPRIFAFQCIGNLISDIATGNHIRHSLFYDFECSPSAARQTCNAILSARDTKISTPKRHRLFPSELLFLEGKIAIWALFECEINNLSWDGYSQVDKAQYQAL